MVVVCQSVNNKKLLLKHLAPLMSLKNNLQMRVKPGLAVAGQAVPR